jgi:hypothetical protein
MSRPTNWAPLLLIGDPVPGCPDTVERGARGYATTADTLTDTANALVGLRDRTITRSRAVDAVLLQAENLACTVRQLQGRYDGAAQALLQYAPALRTAQADSLRILNEARECAGQVMHAAAAVGEADLKVVTSLGDPGRVAQASTDLVHANQNLMRLQGRLVTLRVQIGQVTAARDNAAKAAAARIDSAIEHSGVKDTLWDQLGDLVAKINHALAEIGKFVHKVLTELIRQIATRVDAAWIATRRLLETLAEMVLEGHLLSRDKWVLDAALLITLTAGTVANLLTGTDHTIGARDAAAVGSTRNDTFGRVPVSAASSKQDKARALARLMSQSAELGSPASVRVIKNPGPPPTYTVIVPGTEDWIPGGDTVTDIESNTQLRLDLKSSAEAAVKAAMAEAGVPTGAHVMLVGHSQGGMTSVSLARDPQFSQQYHVDQVVAFGSPVDDKPVPSQTQVLSIANGGDLVPGLDGLPGTLGLPSSNVTRVNFFDPQLDINPFAAIGAAHDPRRYAQHVEEMSGNSQLIRSIDAAMRFMPAENSTATDVQVRAR